MSSDTIIVARESVEMIALPAREAVELLKAGFLLPTDCYREEQTAEWRSLAELAAVLSERKSTSATVESIAAALGRGAGHVAARLRSATGAGSDAFKTRLLEDYVPRIRDSALPLLEKSATSVDRALKDDAFVTKIFGAAYDTLPRAVQRFVGEQQFIEFCMKHRSRLLNKPS